MPTLRELRTAKVLSLQELGDAARVSKSTIHGIEQGRVPHPSTRRALAAALGVDPHQIAWPKEGQAAGGLHPSAERRMAAPDSAADAGTAGRAPS